MRQLRSTFALGLALLASVLVVALTAPRADAATIGLSDQQPATFADPLFKRLGLRHVRLTTPWNAVLTETARLDGWLLAARDAGLEPLVAFEHARSDQCPGSPCVLPAVGDYVAAFRAFRERYPWVTTFETWNEANHDTQPTADRPGATADLYDAMRRECATCTIIGADLLDSGNMLSWVAAFQRSVERMPLIWGLHNYGDVTYGRTTATDQLLAAVPGQVWLTETGGIVYHRHASGVVGQPYDEQRAATAVARALALPATRPRIARVYVYHWRTVAGDRFDAGLLRPDGSPRPSYDAFARALGLPPLAPPGDGTPSPASPTEASPSNPERDRGSGGSPSGGLTWAPGETRASSIIAASIGPLRFGEATLRAARVELPVRCAATRPCSGHLRAVLRIRRAGRSHATALSAGRYRLAPGARRTLSVRLGGRHLRAARRGRGVTIGIAVRPDGAARASRSVPLRRR